MINSHYNEDGECKMFEDVLLKVQKPGRYVGGETGSVVKDLDKVDVRFAFCFPDSYEIGMSHIGMKILYHTLNSLDFCWCERVFAPWDDMEQQMRENNIPLFALESRTPLNEFDIIGFTLQYELSYTNILNMLNLGGVPVLAEERTELKNLVVAGGPCTFNPEPLCKFVDLFFIGEGEQLDNEVVELYRKHKLKGSSKQEFLCEAAQIEGVYVPSLYEVEYNNDGTIKSFEPKNNAPKTVKKRIMRDFDSAPYPEQFVVPYVETVFDRASVELFRGCIRGCRFCQAGFIYRPVREKKAETVNAQARCLCEATGYDEVSLLSLSSSDYTELNELLTDMLSWTEQKRINLALPSLRIDNFSDELLEKIASVKKSGLTFAPEAGTQRLRDAINKNVTEQEVLSTCKTAFEGGYTAVKLYFMMGLPTETLEDIEGIANLAQRIVDMYYYMPNRPKGKSVSVSISCATFVPKPFTPFEFEAQDDFETISQKQQHLVESVKSKKIQLSWHDRETSLLEAVLARGDRRVGEVIYEAWKSGCRFDSWSEFFNFDKWQAAFEKCNVSPEFYANRRREYDEINAWDFIDIGVTKDFLIKQNKLAYKNVSTPHCRLQCAGCGATAYKEGLCCEKR